MERIKHLETTLVLVLALGAVYYLYQLTYLLVVAGVLGIVGLFMPPVAKAIHHAWMKLAEILGFVMSKVLLGLVFVFLVIPLSIMSRIFKSKNGVQLKPKSSSYFKERNFTYNKASLENMW